MLAWIRTGVALMGLGFIVARFGLFLRALAAGEGLAPTARAGVSVWAGTGLLLVGVAVNVFAGWRYGRFAAEFRRGEAKLGPTSAAPELTLAALLAGVGLVLAAYLLRST
jgi:putative membrane protein